MKKRIENLEKQVEVLARQVRLLLARQEGAILDKLGTIKTMIRILPPRQQIILKMRLGLDDGQEKTFEEVGKEFGITRERVRQITEKAIDKVNNYYKIDIQELLYQVNKKFPNETPPH